MERNVGQTDRYVRIVVGIALAVVGVAGFAGTGWEATGTVGLAAAVGLVVVGAVLLITAATQQPTVRRPVDEHVRGAELLSAIEPARAGFSDVRHEPRRSGVPISQTTKPFYTE